MGCAKTDQRVAAEGVTVDLALLIDCHRRTVMGLISQSPAKTEGLYELCLSK